MSTLGVMSVIRLDIIECPEKLLVLSESIKDLRPLYSYMLPQASGDPVQHDEIRGAERGFPFGLTLYLVDIVETPTFLRTVRCSPGQISGSCLSV